MGNITATMVRELRGETGAAMMDCKKALEACSGDVQAAKDHLRKQGLKTAAKKAARETSEGRVFAWVSDDHKLGALVSVSCETDFVARTDNFEAMLTALAKHIAEFRPASVEEFYAQAWGGDEATVEEFIKQVIGKLGENIKVTHVAAFENQAGRIDSYIHHNDKLGVLVNVTSGADADKLEAFTKDLGLHIAFHNPPFMSRDEVSPEDVDRERAIHRETIKDKPAEMQDKIIDGKMGKFYGELVLPEQPWVKDDKKKVQKVLAERLGDDAKIEGFVRYDIG
jgi:elongation factor Ts